MTTLKSYTSKIYQVLVILAMSIISLREIGNSSLGYPDADRILMDGVFIMDFIKNLPLDHIYQYVTEYFGQYPALSIGYRPPFFPFIEAIFNVTFGVNMWSSRLSILAFYVLGVASWYKLVSRIYNFEVAFLSSMFIVTTPFIAKWGWYTMAELPVLSMAMFAGFLFYNYIEEKKSKYCYAAAVVFVLACWTKQTAVFILIWFFIYLFLQGDVISFLKKKEVLISFIIILFGLLPLGGITLWLGKMNIHQSVGDSESMQSISRLSWENLTRHFITLNKFHLTLPIKILSLIGGFCVIIKKDKNIFYFLSLFLATYLFFSMLIGKNERYPIFWIPFFCLLSALPIYYFWNNRLYRLIVCVVSVAILGIQIKDIFNNQPNYATGYDEAARFVLENQKTPIVFFDGYNNGYFTYFIRVLDKNRSTYVLRADKLLSSSAISSNHWLEVHAHSEDDIIKIFDEYGVDLIVVEKDDISKVEIHRILREILEKGPFELLKEIPIETNRTPLAGQKLLIYRYIDSKKGSKNTITIKLPVVGKSITVPIKGFDDNH